MYGLGRYVMTVFCGCFFFFKQKTAYEILTCDWSSDVCSSDLPQREMGSIKSGGAAATKNGQDKKRGRCRNKNLAKKQGAAVTRNGQY